MADIFNRTIGSTIQGADKVDDNNTPFEPQAPIKLAPAVRNVVQVWCFITYTEVLNIW